MTKNEFERLQPGQIIQNKKDNKWSFIVHQNFGDRLTAVRTIEVRDPENWETVTPTPRPQSVPHDSPGLKKAADDLFNLLTGKDWFQTVGIGNNELFIYTLKKKYPKDHKEFGGFPVQYRYMGQIKPA